MTDPQEDKLSMYYAVIAASEKHTAAWQTLPAFVTQYGLFTAQVDVIRDTIDGQIQGISGAARDKAERRQEMAELAYPVASVLQAWALENDDAELADRVSFTLSDFLHDRDTVAEEYAQLVHDEANANVASLADYGVDAAKLSALAAAIAAYHTALTAPRLAITDRKAATAALKVAFAEADKILKERLDKLVPILTQDHPAFATDWGNARIIVDSGGGGGGGSGGGGNGNGNGGGGSEPSSSSSSVSSSSSSSVSSILESSTSPDPPGSSSSLIDDMSSASSSSLSSESSPSSSSLSSVSSQSSSSLSSGGGP